MINYEWLASQFYALDYQWSFNGNPRHPSAEDLQRAIDRLTKELYDDGQQAEMGRLIVQKNGKHYDIYLYVGEADDRSTVHQQD